MGREMKEKGLANSVRLALVLPIAPLAIPKGEANSQRNPPELEEKQDCDYNDQVKNRSRQTQIRCGEVNV